MRTLDQIAAVAGNMLIANGPLAGFGLKIKELLGMPEELKKSARMRTPNREASIQKAFAQMMLAAKLLADLLELPPQDDAPLAPAPGAPGGHPPLAIEGPQAVVAAAGVQSVPEPSLGAQLRADFYVHFARSGRTIMKWIIFPLCGLLRKVPSCIVSSLTAVAIGVLLFFATHPEVVVILAARILRLVPSYLAFVLERVSRQLEIEFNVMVAEALSAPSMLLAEQPAASNETSFTHPQPPHHHSFSILSLIVGVLGTRLAQVGWTA